MINSLFLETLIEFGLSEHESNVYLASLSLGPATIQKIAEGAEIKRTTVYSVVESLKQKGLMLIEVKGLKKLYTAENPEKLDILLEQRQGRLQSLLPQLSAIYNLKGGESFIKYYTGLEAVKNIYETLIKDIKPHQDYLVISDEDQWINLDEKYFRDFTERRAKLNINTRLLLVDTPDAREFKKFEKNFNVKIKLLPPKTKLVTNLVVTPQRVLIHQLIPPIIGIVIENKSVIQMHQESFEIMWNSIPE